ncbi:MAG: cold shock domain-containing protein [Planctomycetia bacterium]|nr:cold shock domain-containing protein [Planctomycetia bacterium]
MASATGKVVRVMSRGFGFIQEDGSKTFANIYFHATDLSPGLRFDDPQLLGREVQFNIEEGTKGKVARNIRPAS